MNKIKVIIAWIWVLIGLVIATFINPDVGIPFTLVAMIYLELVLINNKIPKL